MRNTTAEDKTCSNVKRIKFAVIRGIEKGVLIGEDLFLNIEFQKGRWRLKLKDLKEERAITGWVTTRNIEELRTSRNSKPIRDALKGEVESVIRFVQDNEHRWIEEEVEKIIPPKFDGETESKIDEEARRIFEADNQLTALWPHLDVLIVGEDKNKLTIFVLLVGSKYDGANMKVILILKGTEGGGKTVLARGTVKGYNFKEVGRFTRHALDYSDLENFEVLYIKELGKLDEEESGVSTLKFVSGDDLGYTVESTIRDEETGRLRAESHRIPPITVISTTTRLSLDRQLERRAWLIPVDESEKLTKKVVRVKAERERQEAEKKLGLRKITDYEFSRAVVERFVERLKPVEVVIPFPLTLTEVYSSGFLRLRGDIDKIYTFVKLYGSLNLKRLWKLNGDVYAVTPQVAVEALEIIREIMTRMLVKTESRTEEVLKALKKIRGIQVGTKRETGEPIYVRPINQGDQITKRIREQLAILMGKAEPTIRHYLNALELGGYMSGDDKKPKTHTLLCDVDEILEKIRGESVILQSSDILMSKMHKEASEWLKPKLDIQFEEGTSYLPFEPSAPSEKKIHTPSPVPISNYDLALKKRDSKKKAEENRINKKLPTIPRESDDETQEEREKREQDERLTEWLKRGMIPKRDTDLQRGEERSD